MKGAALAGAVSQSSHQGMWPSPGVDVLFPTLHPPTVSAASILSVEWTFLTHYSVLASYPFRVLLNQGS